MKGAIVYLGALLVGAGVGAIGMGAYNVVVVGVEAEASDSTALAEEGGETHEGEDAPVQAGDPEETAGDTLITQGDLPEEAASESEGAGDEGEEEPSPADGPQVVEAPPPDPDSLARAQLNFQRLARIFAAMAPDEAAPVLSQLDDDHLEGILLAMQSRNAAPILAEMDPDRAASISRRVLRGGGG